MVLGITAEPIADEEAPKTSLTNVTGKVSPKLLPASQHLDINESSEIDVSDFIKSSSFSDGGFGNR